MDKNKILGGTLLVCGTAIGAGMLALPLSTAQSGFFYSAGAFLACWLFTTVAALLLLEVNLWLPGEKDLLSMVGATFGRFGKALAWVVYLLLLYALICAYLKGSSAWLLKLLETGLHINLSNAVGMVIIAVFFGGIISFGTAVSDKFNRVLALGLVVAYVALIASAIQNIELDKLEGGEIAYLPATLPLIITSFGFSVVLPSLTNYLNRDAKALQWVVILGSLLPLIIYLLWEGVTLGIIPMSGDHGLLALMQQHDDGTGVTVALENIVGNRWITEGSRWFAIFAILTSLVGVSLALFHFLADGLQMNAKKAHNKSLLLCLTYVPPLAFILLYPSGFGRILSFAGLFVALLLGVLPALMVWRKRYYLTKHKNKKEHPAYQVWGGKGVLLLVLFFFLYVIYLESVNCLSCNLL